MHIGRLDMPRTRLDMDQDGISATAPASLGRVLLVVRDVASGGGWYLLPTRTEER